MKVAWIALLLALTVAAPASANNLPAPQMVLAEIAILPLMMLLTAAGGGYAILGARRRGKPPMFVLVLLGVILIILFSLINGGAAFLVLIVFVWIATTRAVRMIIWAVNPPQIESVRISRARLGAAGGTLLILSLFVGGLAAAFVMHWESQTQGFRLAAFRRYVALQIALGGPESAQLEKNREEYESSLKHVIHEYREGPERLVIERRPGGGFSAFMPPMRRLPFFPYKYLTSAPSYYASEKGEIRMVRVRDWNDRCPVDAPIVDRVSAEDFQALARGDVVPDFSFDDVSEAAPGR